MKRKTDTIVGPPSSLIQMICAGCGLNSDSNPFLVFWRDRSGELFCSNCFCEKLKQLYDQLLDENFEIHRKDAELIAQTLDSSIKTQEAYQKKFEELIKRIEELEKK